MQGKVLEGDLLTGWERRQPKRGDDGSAQRKRRQRNKEQSERDEEHVTQCHAVSRSVTPEERRGEERDSRRAASAANGEDPEPDPWAFGVGLLKAAGTPEQSARTYIGRLVKEHGKDHVAAAVGRAQVAQPVEPKAWLRQALKEETEQEPFMGDT